MYIYIYIYGIRMVMVMGSITPKKKHLSCKNEGRIVRRVSTIEYTFKNFCKSLVILKDLKAHFCCPLLCFFIFWCAHILDDVSFSFWI
jgi:hypothetical protein